MKRRKPRFRWTLYHLQSSAQRSDQEILEAVNWCLELRRERIFDLAYKSRSWAQSRLQKIQEKQEASH
jgi:hypothetical protein